MTRARAHLFATIEAIYARTRASILAYQSEQHPTREQCGERRGYKAHRRRGEVPCIHCREANTSYQRARVAARKDAA